MLLEKQFGLRYQRSIKQVGTTINRFRVKVGNAFPTYRLGLIKGQCFHLLYSVYTSDVQKLNFP